MKASAAGGDGSLRAMSPPLMDALGVGTFGTFDAYLERDAQKWGSFPFEGARRSRGGTH